MIIILEFCFALSFGGISAFVGRLEEIEFLAVLSLVYIFIIVPLDKLVCHALSFLVGTDRLRGSFSRVLLISSLGFENVMIIIIFHTVGFFLGKALTARDFLSGSSLCLS